MKTLLILAATTILLVSCGRDKTPDDKIYSTDVTLASHVPDGVGNPPKAVYDTTVTLRATWGQANQLASQRGDYAIWQILGWLLFIGLIVFVVFWVRGSINGMSANAIGVTLFLVAALSLTSCKWQASAIKWGEGTEIPKPVYDHAMKVHGTTAPVWDSLAAACKISGGPYKCYK
jgi:hypothetical protein